MGVHSYLIDLIGYECTPMWSATIFGVHSHLVLIIFKNALRSAPLPLYFSRKPLKEGLARDWNIFDRYHIPGNFRCELVLLRHGLNASRDFDHRIFS